MTKNEIIADRYTALLDYCIKSNKTLAEGAYELLKEGFFYSGADEYFEDFVLGKTDREIIDAYLYD